MPATNLIFFSIDDMRAPDDWGHFTPLLRMPNLERLADMGTSFERAITPVPVCNPARTSVLTGQQPTETGVLDNATRWYDRVAPADTLPAVLKAAGVHVAMFGKHFHYAPDAAAQAVMFDEYVHDISSGNPDQVIDDGVRHDEPFASGRYSGSPSNISDERTAAAAIDFLRNTASDLDQPFFLGVGINKPHLDWWAPSRFFDLYDPAQIRSALLLSLADGSIIPGAGEYFDVPPMSGPSVEHAAISGDIDLWVDYIHAYMACMSYADSTLGRVLNALEEDPALAADTSIVLWSDHGYHLGDKDRWNKFTHWRESTEVPLIIVDPEAEGGQSARQVVSLVDIFPTVLDLMDVDAPSRLRLDGDSLLPIVRDADIPWYAPATGKGVALTTIYGSVSIRVDIPGRGDFRYTRYPDGTEELYDIGTDPGEHVNRIDFETGAGLTARDTRTRAIMSDLMDDQLAAAGYFVSDGTTETFGTSGADILVSVNGPGSSSLAGRGGADAYVLYEDAAVTEAAGRGIDTVYIMDAALETTYRLAANVEDMVVQASATGNDLANRIYLNIDARGPVLPSVVRGEGGDDRIHGDDTANLVYGGAGADSILTGGGSDTLRGDAGADTLVGANGDDLLVGGAGADSLDGGSGLDTYRFGVASHSGPAGSDVIVRFDAAGAAAGDRIDLSIIDANTEVAGNQAFVIGGTKAGRLRLANEAGDTVVLGYVDSDAAFDLRIVIRDGSRDASAYGSEDFVL